MAEEIGVKITVTTADTQGTAQEQQPANAEKQTGEKVSSTNFLKVAGTAGVLAATGKNLYSFTTGRISRFTGSSVAQTNYSAAMSILGYGAAIAANPVLGLTLTALSVGERIYDYNYAFKWENREATQKAKMLGLLNDRSRNVY